MKRLFRREFAFTAWLVLLGLAVASLASARAEEAIPSEPLEDSAAASPNLKFLPKDYWLAAEVDCAPLQAFFSSPDAQRNPQYAQFKQMLQLAKAFTGIDLEKEVDRVAVFLSGDADREPQYLFVVQGTFDNQVVEARITQTLGKAVSEKTYKDTTVYSGPAWALSFPVEKTILFGKEALVHESIDRLKGKKVSLPAAVKKVLERTPGDHFIWAAVRPRAILDSRELGDWRDKNADLNGSLQKLECASFAFSAANDGLLVNALGYAAGTDEAKQVYDYLNARKSALLSKEGSNVFAASFLILSELNTSGPYVQGSFRITAKSLEELWKTKVIVKPKPKGDDE
jgi:hypothetical protein